MGEVNGEATTALYRGLVAGRACELLHQEGFDQDTSNVTVSAAAFIQKQLAEENRMLTQSVEENRLDILAEVTDCLNLYRDRFAHLFHQCELLGTEVPARYSLSTEDGEIKFASHLDLVVRDTNGVFGYGKGKLLVMDWKWRQQSPSHQYLARNMQFALYYMMAKWGYLKCGPKAFEWMDYGEDAVLFWIHLPGLKPYTRRTTAFNDQGEEQEFVKGDLRPMRSVLYRVEYDSAQEHLIKAELKMRAKMVENDVFPLNPDPVSCRICDAEAFCTRFDTATIGDSNQ
ncbi:MAG: hypothetical protein Unbinned3138contig1001_7 [Prokaryotic dsDNA virus sp.]|nr:MAG: hypothetical protein Unbinned3138contig1001_7 [Prokaryotic dsDNA virus sp.]|tara:strand:+ start:4411 stop:5268 length:858 start_codon:yes stop_codon:yes gene_type:complete